MEAPIKFPKKCDHVHYILQVFGSHSFVWNKNVSLFVFTENLFLSVMSRLCPFNTSVCSSVPLEITIVKC